MKLWQKIKSVSRLHRLREAHEKLITESVNLASNHARLKQKYNDALIRNVELKDGNRKLKEANHALLTQHQDNYLKRDLLEAINIIVDYQKTLYRLVSPDPNVQRANDLLNKWGVQSERVHDKFKIMIDGKDITMGREF